MRGMVLYYNTVQSPNVTRLRGVLVRMGVRIKNITPEQMIQTVGYLARIEEYPESEIPEVLPVIEEEVLVMRDFTSKRMGELLMSLRKAGVPKIAPKAVVAESNCGWSFYHSYEEIREEHKKMSLWYGDKSRELS